MVRYGSIHHVNRGGTVSMIRALGVVVVVTMLAAACAQPAPPPEPVPGLDTTIASIRAQHDTVTGWVVAAAAQVPEETYSYQPTPEVRTFAELFGHIANITTMLCSMASGMEQPEGTPDAEALTSKAELEQALAAAVTFCDSAFAGVTPANGAETMDLFGTETSRVGVLAFNNGHNMEHYGNLVTYLRLNGMVPPSSR